MDDQVRAAIVEAITQAKYNMADGPRRNETYKHLVEALLWYDSPAVLKSIPN